ncbi:MAG: acetyl-CoA carboxylase biotin carboxyl carrier protein [Bergeyella sp.]|nr:acetyl-CoA carboxylase biotin carboxyl carrier protein [Bergeyella sp.]
MDIKDIQNLVRFVSKSEVSEVKYKTKDFEITIKTKIPLSGSDFSNFLQQPLSASSQQPMPITTPLTPAASQNPSAPTGEIMADERKYVTIKAPMIGTFYRKPSPEKDPYVSVGDEVSEGKVVCIIEAMKLFNQVESEVKGKIVKILVDDATPVEYDQPLFLVDPH